MELRCPKCNTEFSSTQGDHPTESFPITPSAGSTKTPGCTGSLKSPSQTETITYRPETWGELSRFSLLEKLGAGAYGVVFRARDKDLDRTVALKLPHPGVGNTVDKDMALREARAAAQLSHANIVSLYEVIHHEESVCLVSDYIDGIPLSARLEAGRLTERESIEVVEKLAAALEHAHQRGVIHRDLKPSNVLVDNSGEPYITDFGLAKRDVGEVTMTEDGQVLGTPAYMSPEQAAGDSHAADARSDIYSLGVMLFEFLTGERPFRGNSRVLIFQVIHDEPPSPRKFSRNISKDLETICLRCLEKSPKDRFQSAGELADELGRVRRGEPIRSRPIGWISKVWRWCRRYPDKAWMMLTLFVLLPILTVLSVSSMLIGRERDKARAAEAAAVTARDDAIDAQAKEAIQRKKAQDLAAQEAALKQQALDAAQAERLAKIQAEIRRKEALSQRIFSDINAIIAQEQEQVATAAVEAERLAKFEAERQRAKAEEAEQRAIFAADQERKARLVADAAQREFQKQAGQLISWKRIATLNEWLLLQTDR